MNHLSQNSDLVSPFKLMVTTSILATTTNTITLWGC